MAAQTQWFPIPTSPVKFRGTQSEMVGDMEAGPVISIDNDSGPQRPNRWSYFRRTLLHGVWGFGFGYVVLHPVAMVIFGLLGKDHIDGTMGHAPGLVSDSFTIEMIPMGLFFGVFGLLLGSLDGFYRTTVHNQRDGLAHQLALNREYRVELERTVGELQVQNTRLEALERGKRRSTQFLVHDLKGNLGCIIGFADLLLERAQQKRDWEETDALDRIVRQGRSMMTAVRDLLDIAKLENTDRIDTRPVRVSELFADACEQLSVAAANDSMTIGERHRDAPDVLADRKLVVRVLSNLTLNALKHNVDGTQVHLDAEVQGGASDLVVFSCSDTGDGIPEHLLPSIFDEFSSSIDAWKESSGLGLTFCKTAIEAHGGSIWCENSLDTGTTFCFTVPTAG